MDGREIIQMSWKRVSHLHETDLRLDRFLRHLKRFVDLEVAYTIEALYIGALHKERACLVLLEAFSHNDSLKSHFSNDRLRNITLMADQNGLIFAAELLGPSSQPRVPKKEITGYQDIKDIALGEKKALARSCTPDMLEKLLAEPEPSIIHNLLRHPKILERDVLTIVSRRPNLPEIIETVWFNRKWSLRYPVRLAIASNPYSPARMARVAIASLSVRDVRRLKNMRLYPGIFLDILIKAMKGLEEEAVMIAVEAIDRGQIPFPEVLPEHKQ